MKSAGIKKTRGISEEEAVDSEREEERKGMEKKIFGKSLAEKLPVFVSSSSSDSSFSLWSEGNTRRRRRRLWEWGEMAMAMVKLMAMASSGTVHRKDLFDFFPFLFSFFNEWSTRNGF